MRTISCMLGTFIGDSLGAPFECVKSNDPFLVNWDGNSFVNNPNHKFLKDLPPGSSTDDTAASVIIAKSLVESNGFNPDDLVKRYVDWIYNSDDNVGTGGTILAAIKNLRYGISYLESGIMDSQGNGTAMRAACFGVFFRKDFLKMKEAVITDSNITHNSDCARDGAFTIASTAYYLTNNPDIDKYDLLSCLHDNLNDGDIKNKIRLLTEVLKSNLSNEAAVKKIGSRFNVIDTVPLSLYCLLSSHSFKEGVVKAIKTGNDADTVGAIVGALSGIKYGLEGIPDNFVSQSKNSNIFIELDKKLMKASENA